MQWNAEGILSQHAGYSKKTELENFLYAKKISVCCIQETHLKPEKPFTIRGYQCFRSDRIDRRNWGVLTLVKNSIPAYVEKSHSGGAEFQQLQLKVNNMELKLLNYYYPNDRSLSLSSLQVPSTNYIAVGDFNGHSQSWGYNHLDQRGEEIESWQDEHSLLLINKASDKPTFYSRRWHSTSTPDLAFATSDISGTISREVGNQLGGSDHLPIILTVNGVNLTAGPAITRWNYKKANWGLYRHRVNTLISELQVQNRDINTVTKQFNSIILKAAKDAIPKGFRRNYKPFWSNTLQEREEAMIKARQEAESNPSLANHIKWNKAFAEFQRTKLEEKRKSWRMKTAALNFDKDCNKLWRLTQSLNEDTFTPRQTIILEENGKLSTGKQAADLFAERFKSDSNMNIHQDSHREIRAELQAAREPIDILPQMKEPITMREMQYGIAKLKFKKSPGPDEISNEMIINLGPAAKTKLLEIYNHSWMNGTVPQVWREAITIPIHKKGKCKSQASSYRPISLTSTVGKVLERVVNHRLKWHLESEHILAPEQAGFRECYSIEDQVTYLSQSIEDAFQKMEKVLTLWVDFKQAFDKVWKEELVVKLQRCGIHSNMIRWIQSYLHNRRTKVRLDGIHSKKVLICQGVPQGGVVSPTLFLVYINDLVKDLPAGVKAALYADDLVLYCTNKHTPTMQSQMQQAVDMLKTWTEKWHVTINLEKTSTSLFTLSPKDTVPNLYLGNILIKEENYPTYLGVTFDRRLTWKQQIENAVGKARRRLGLLRKLAGTSWGANEQTLKKVYNGVVRPHLEYCSAAWATSANTHLKSLDKVNNQALRVITGAMKSTPILEMLKITNIQSLSHRRDTKTMIQMDKYNSMQMHPMKARLDEPVLERLKRSSFVHQGKKLQRQHQADLPLNTMPLKPTLQPVLWEQASDNLQISTSINGLELGQDYNELQKRTATLSMIQERYPEHTYIQAYTDGSAVNAVRNGGAGIYILYPENQQRETRYAPTGKYCSNFSAEAQAIEQAAGMIYSSNSDCSQAVIFTDALAVLQALKSGKLSHLRSVLDKVSERYKVTLQWVPLHCGVPGNERADSLAKKGGECEQPDNEVTYFEKKRAIQAIR
ncbi:hypothetical protein BsWGS_10914 [Bradybaena similaris]